MKESLNVENRGTHKPYSRLPQLKTAQQKAMYTVALRHFDLYPSNIVSS